MDLVSTARAGSVLRVTLRRPEKRNALNVELAGSLCDALAAGAADPEVAVIVLDGEGGTLSAGADISGGLTGAIHDYAADPRSRLPKLLRSLEVPTVAVVDGYALGAGAALAGACDYTVATGRSVFGLPEARLGFFPFGIVPFLVDRMAPATALEWGLSARRVPAGEAARAGLVTHLVPDESDLAAEVDALVGALASVSPAMARQGKRWLIQHHASSDHDERVAWCEQQIAGLLTPDEPAAGAAAAAADAPVASTPRGGEPTVARTDFTEPSTDPERLRRLRTLLAERVAGPEVPLAARRAEFEAVMAKTPLVEGVSVEAVDAGGVAGLHILPDGVTPVAAVLYLHGGGYGLGSARTVLPMASRIALAARAVVVSLDYGLAPEHPFPVARDQVLAAHSWLSALYPGLPVFLGGDSAGGGLTVSALLSLRDAGSPVAGGFGISPWSDLTMAGASLDTNAATDPQVARWMLEEFADAYVGVGGDRAAPGVSPALADLTGLAPLLIQVSRAEALYDDGQRLAEAAGVAGVEVTLQTWPDVPHVWHGFAPKVLEADAAIAEIGTWIGAHLGKG